MRRPIRLKSSEFTTLVVTPAPMPPCISTPWKAPQLGLKASPAISARWNPGCLRRYSAISALAWILVEPLHLAAVGAIGEVVLRAIAEFEQEQENQQDMRLGGGQGLTAPGGEQGGGK